MEAARRTARYRQSAYAGTQPWEVSGDAGGCECSITWWSGRRGVGSVWMSLRSGSLFEEVGFNVEKFFSRVTPNRRFKK